MAQKKLILNMAISLEGYIAREDGSFDWIAGDGNKSHNTTKQFDFNKFLESIDTVIMGRKAYEDLPEESYGMYKSKKVYVASKKEIKKVLDDIEFISGDITKFILDLKKEKGKDIWLYGGAGLVDPFIKSNLIDEYIIGIIPIILGEGRPLFLKNNPTIKLSLTESTVNQGIIINRYKKNTS